MTLDKLHSAYERNFAMLVKTKGTPLHKKYLKIERKLEKRCLAIQKKSNTYIYNPCPIRYIKDCLGCSGWYKGSKESKSGVGERCVLKNVRRVKI